MNRSRSDGRVAYRFRVRWLRSGAVRPVRSLTTPNPERRSDIGWKPGVLRIFTQNPSPDIERGYPIVAEAWGFRATLYEGGDGLDLQRRRNLDSRPLALPLLARSRSRSAFLLLAFSAASWRWSSNHSVVRGNGFLSSGSTGGKSSVGSFGFSMGSRFARLGLSEYRISVSST